MADSKNSRDSDKLLESLKMLLGIASDEADMDEKLAWIVNSARARLKLLLGGIEPPMELDYMITEVAVIRFNRISSEGVKSQTVEGESNSYADSDFDGFKDEIQAFLDSQKGATRGKVQFI